jgi:hypothetical protein
VKFILSLNFTNTTSFYFFTKVCIVYEYLFFQSMFCDVGSFPNFFSQKFVLYALQIFIFRACSVTSDNL